MVKNLMKKSRIQQRCSKRNLQYGMPIRATACGQTRINWVVELERCPSIISKSRPFISTSTNVPKLQCPTKQRTKHFLFKASWQRTQLHLLSILKASLMINNQETKFIILMRTAQSIRKLYTPREKRTWQVELRLELKISRLSNQIKRRMMNLEPQIQQNLMMSFR